MFVAGSFDDDGDHDWLAALKCTVDFCSLATGDVVVFERNVLFALFDRGLTENRAERLQVKIIFFK